MPALAALPALPAGAPGPPRRRYGQGWLGRAPLDWGWGGKGATRPPTRVSTPRRFLTELGGVRGLQLNFLELGSNRAGWLQVWRRHRAPGSSLVSLGCTVGPDAGVARPTHPLRSPQWQVRFDCFPAESGRQVLVSLRTIPDRGLALSRSRLVVAEPPGEAGRDPGGASGGTPAPADPPHLLHRARLHPLLGPRGAGHRGVGARGPCPDGAAVPPVGPGVRGAAPALPPAGNGSGCPLPGLPAMLPPQLTLPLCPQVLVPGGRHISLPYEFLVPCLCIEVRRPPLQLPSPSLPVQHGQAEVGWGHILP